MAKTTIDTWSTDFINQSVMFEPVSRAAQIFMQSNDWPSLKQINQQFKTGKINIQAVPQGDKPGCFEEQYEPRIYLKGELQTRTRNWHDFFNALVWMSFSKTKSELNRLHYFEALQREAKSNRSNLENAITLFDECGCIIISSDPDLLDMIRNHQWQALFLDHRAHFEKTIRCCIFGHAMFEKALKPYIGMTCQAILIHSDRLLNAGQEELDQQLASLWRQGSIRKPSDLSPFPVLGVPGWYDGEQSQAFYANTDYFRPAGKK